MKQEGLLPVIFLTSSGLPSLNTARTASMPPFIATSRLLRSELKRNERAIEKRVGKGTGPSSEKFQRTEAQRIRTESEMVGSATMEVICFNPPM